MLLVILLIVVAIATGVLGVAVKGLLWLFVITAHRDTPATGLAAATSVAAWFTEGGSR